MNTIYVPGILQQKNNDEEIPLIEVSEQILVSCSDTSIIVE